MIKGLVAGPGIQVDGSYNSMPYINMNTNNPVQGMLRVNGSDMQVFDGTSWVHLSMSHPTVSLNPMAQSAIDWAWKKMAEEELLKKLAEKHPAVADAVNTVNEAYSKLKVVVALTEEEEQK
jgi:hypothetical protein